MAGQDVEDMDWTPEVSLHEGYGLPAESDYYGVIGHLSDEELLKLAEAMKMISDAWPVIQKTVQDLMSKMIEPVKTAAGLMAEAAERASRTDRAATKVRESNAADEGGRTA